MAFSDAKEFGVEGCGPEGFDEYVVHSFGGVRGCDVCFEQVDLISGRRFKLDFHLYFCIVSRARCIA